MWLHALGASSPIGPATMVVATVGLVLAIFVLGVLVMGRARRRRLAERGVPKSPAVPDAWSEAGRRMPPPPPGDEMDMD